MQEFDSRRYIIDNIGVNDEDNSITSENKSIKETEDIDIAIGSLLMLESLNSVMRYIKPKQSYHYLLLDSANAIFSPDRSTMQWLINDGDPIARPNYINLTRQLRNIVMMRLGRVSWSSMDQTNTTILTNNHIGLGFSEFASQSLIMPSGPRLHFIQYNYDIMHTGNTITTSSFFENRGRFRFRKQFTKLDTLTLSLWNLANVTPIIIPNDYVSINAIQYCNTIDYHANYINLSRLLPIIYPQFRGVPSYNDPLTVLGEQFQFSGFTTNDPVADAAIISSYNSLHTINFIIIETSPYISPPVDISSASLNEDQQVPIVITFLYKPRMVAALELITED